MSAPEHEVLDKLWAEDALHSLDLRARGNDDIGVVIDLHLRLENTLVEILMARLPNPVDLGVDDLSFPVKARVAGACGYIGDELKPLLYINSLRNKVAHNLDYKINRDAAFHLEKLIYGDNHTEENLEDQPPIRRILSVGAMIGGRMVGRAVAYLEISKRSAPPKLG